MQFFSSKQTRRKEYLAEPFPEEWQRCLDQNVFLYRLLSDDERARLQNALRIFIAEKFWEGCAGLQITDEIRVTIAAQACILLLGLPDYYFDELKTILVYPGGYLGIESDSLGKEDRVSHRLGEAHHGGPVILSWWQARWDSRRLGYSNVVLHEFAHKLAELGDPQAGIPPLADPNETARWEEVIGVEYETLVENAEYQRPTLLDHYGAKNRAEFFAVATECFFLQPRALRERHGTLYGLLAAWYRQEPAERRIDHAIAIQAEEAAGEFAQHAITECTNAIRLRPDYVDAYRQRADYYRDLGQFDDAIRDWTKVIQLTSGDEKADAYYERAVVHFIAKSHRVAIADFDEAIRRAGSFAQAYRDRGSAYAAMGQHDRALADLTHALRLDSKDDAAYIERGLVYYDQKKFDKAVRDFTRAIRLAPHVATAYSNRALAHIGQGEYDLAIHDCDEALRIDANIPEPYKHRGVAHGEKGEWDLAITDLNEAIRIDTNCIEAYRARAVAYHAKGCSEQAHQDQDQVKKLESGQD
jgi:Mlc titration factor MtfA (ptsG expression regulator)/Tfp pilus assembly protein PilF